MKDRVPRYPGRVQLTPVPGQANTYDLVRADDPVEAGTPLNKASLLHDNTATALGLSGDPTVNQALANVAPRIKALEDSLKFVKLADVTISSSVQQVDIVLPKTINNYSEIQIYLSNMRGASVNSTYFWGLLQGQTTSVYRGHSGSSNPKQDTLFTGYEGYRNAFGLAAQVDLNMDTLNLSGQNGTIAARITGMSGLSPSMPGGALVHSGYNTADGGLPLSQINTINIATRQNEPFLQGRIVIYGVLV